MPTAALLGRDDELALLAGLVGAVPGHGAALVLRGEPGVGKSALLAAARTAAAGRLDVLDVTGVESEAHVPFSGLHRLLGPVLAGADALPARQRDALLSAFGLAQPAAEPYLVGYAALELVTDRAARTPVLLLVDDVQWLDSASASALAFLARRIAHEPVVALLAARDGTDSPLLDGSLPERVVPVLDPSAAAQLLERHGRGLPAPARRQVLEQAAGNPLALVELATAWSPTDEDLVAPRVLTARLENAFARRLTALDDDVALAALVAAASDTEDLAEVVRATAAITGAPCAEDLLAAAADAGVLVLDGDRVRFRHPLLRAACYHRASPSRRRTAHAALADTLAGAPERRTWHRAAATVGPADDLAAELEAAADRATRRGAAGAGVTALVRAAALSSSPNERGRRLTTAAGLAFEGAMGARGAELLRQAAACDLTEEDRLRLSWLNEWFGDPGWSGADKVRALCRLVLRSAAQGRHEQAGRMLLDIALRCWWSNPDDVTTRTLHEAADTLAPHLDDATATTVLAYGAPLERGRTVLEHLSALTPGTIEDPVAAVHLGTAATAVGDFPTAGPLLDEAVLRLRGRGDLVQLLRALVARMLTDLHLGRWDAARATGDEVRTLTVDTAQPLWGMAATATETLVAAAQGDEERVDTLARQVDTFFLALGATTFMAPAELARGHAALAAGRHEQALHHLRRVADPDGAVHHRYARRWGTVDHVAAAVALGLHDEARAVVGQVAVLWERTGSPLLGAQLVVVRPLVAPDDVAEELFRQGLTGRLTAWPFLHARHLLGYGTWLRRHRRARDSRPPLRAARDVLDALGAVPWHEQAVRELRASGETTRACEPGSHQRLSPQERQIAELAASGLTNREIGQHLFLSHRTVGSHLYRVFPKLGITSRAQLSTALLTGPRDAALG